MKYEHILFECNEGIAVITINRPKFMNALCGALNLEMLDGLDRIEKDHAVRAVILSGGPKVFAAGADIAEMINATPGDAEKTAALGHRVHDTIEALPVPVIAAVNGPALGGGCELALACDFRIAAEDALFALPEVSLGIIPGAGGTQRLLPLVGPAVTREMVLLGRKVKGDEAERIGLANKAVQPGAVMESALEMARKLAKMPAVALALAKQAILAGLNETLNQG
ncbi:MAG: enoyl-CoA hydratase/isomerase family protein, partial [Treponema sp.]|nr:enoyl-CoA hydratase/isomerase family protein [Treponema sp.]